MSISEPRVAVIMTCYNEGPFLDAAIESVLSQSSIELIKEIVIADDGSVPDTVATLKRWEAQDSRIRVLYGPGGAGLPAQRNWAISETTAPLIAILDGDDVWAQDKIAKQLEYIDDHPDVGLVYSDYYAFPDGDLAGARRAGVLDITTAANLSRAYFLNDPPIIPSTTLMRRTAFDAVDGFDANIRVFEDTDFFLRLAKVCRFGLIDKPLLYKRFRQTSITGGRKDLMAHHALVALKAAALDRRLLRLVPRRLAERARKLGNHRFLLGDRAEALDLLRFAVQLDPLNHRAWASLAAAFSLTGPALRLVEPILRRRRVAIGA